MGELQGIGGAAGFPIAEIGLSSFRRHPDPHTASTRNRRQKPRNPPFRGFADCRARDAEVREQRVDDDDDVVTAGGVTAGIDLASHLLDRECGPDVDNAVAADLESERAI